MKHSLFFTVLLCVLFSNITYAQTSEEVSEDAPEEVAEVKKANALTESDRIALAEKLEKIQKRSNDRVEGLYRRALSDYRSAVESNDRTMQLYLKCVEQVRFKDEKKKGQDFREWKRKNKEKHQSESFRRALRHQLAWLLLSIEAAHKGEDHIQEMGKRALTHLDQILGNAEKLRGHQAELKRDALSSVFAQAYKLNIKVKDWPKSSMDIAQIFEKLVFPPLRESRNIRGLRSAWDKRIKYEEIVVKNWSGKGQGRSNGKKGKKIIGMKKAMLSPAYEKFMSNRRPDLLWQKEVDCFRIGDERGAALKMLAHVDKYIKHKNAPKWIEEFQKLLTPPEPVASPEEGDGEEEE